MLFKRADCVKCGHRFLKKTGKHVSRRSKGKLAPGPSSPPRAIKYFWKNCPSDISGWFCKMCKPEWDYIVWDGKTVTKKKIIPQRSVTVDD